MYTYKELDETAREIDATVEGCFAMGFGLEERVEIILDILRDKLGIEGSWSIEDHNQGNLIDK